MAWFRRKQDKEMVQPLCMKKCRWILKQRENRVERGKERAKREDRVQDSQGAEPDGMMAEGLLQRGRANIQL